MCFRGKINGLRWGGWWRMVSEVATKGVRRRASGVRQVCPNNYCTFALARAMVGTTNKVTMYEYGLRTDELLSHVKHTQRLLCLLDVGTRTRSKAMPLERK